MANTYRRSPFDHHTTKRSALSTLTNQHDYLQPQPKQFAGNDAKMGINRPAICHATGTENSSIAKSITAESPMVVSSTQLQDRSLPAEATREEQTRAVLGSAEYCCDVLRSMKDRETKLRARPLYMSEQTDINASMRTILVDWLVEVTEEFRLSTETLHLAINFTDRFLSIMHVQRNKLQLVGTSSMLLACKLEEIHPPEVSMFVEITDNTYTSDQVKTMEMFILRHLNYELSAPTSFAFMHGFVDMSRSSEQSLHLGLYFCELALLNSDPFLKFVSSRIAAASLCLARHTLGLDAWPNELKAISGYTLSELLPVISPLYAHFVTQSKQDIQQSAVTRKYSRSCHLGVAYISPTAGVPSLSSIETTC